METEEFKGIMDSIGGLADKLESKIEAGNTVMFGKIDEIKEEIGGKDGIRERLVRVEGRQSAMETQMGNLEKDQTFIRGELSDIKSSLPEQPCEEFKEHIVKHKEHEVNKVEFRKKVWKTVVAVMTFCGTGGGLIYKFWPSK